MGAATPYQLRVLVTREESVTVSAVTLEEAKRTAEELPNVILVLGQDKEFTHP
jgi:hypothetical protein